LSSVILLVAARFAPARGEATENQPITSRLNVRQIAIKSVALSPRCRATLFGEPAGNSADFVGKSRVGGSMSDTATEACER
jgi:hypothetical protein